MRPDQRHWTYIVWCVFWMGLFLTGAAWAVRWMKANLDSWNFTWVGLGIVATCILIGLLVDRARSRPPGAGPGA